MTGTRTRGTARIADRVIATTSESGEDLAPPTAIYEFDLQFNFLRATYNDRYWEGHHRLELQGQIHHSREACPDRAGPPAIDVWTRAGGWRQVRPGEGLFR